MPILRLRADAGRIPLADGSVHCVATSPPYFGLRKYAGVPDGVWGGDAAHAHEWGPLERPGVAVRGNSPGDLSTSSLTNAERQDVVPRVTTAGAFCACGAWRGCLGNEPTVGLYVAHIVACFKEVRRVLRDDGVCWVVLGDSFSAASTHGGDAAAKRGPLDKGEHGKVTRVETGALRDGIPAGNLLGVPWRVALSLQADGWLLRNDVVWAKKAPMPESVSGWEYRRHRIRLTRLEHEALSALPGDEANRDAVLIDCPGCRTCTPNDGLVLRRGSWRHTRAHESVFMLAKSMAYFCDAEAVAERASAGSHGGGQAHAGRQMQMSGRCDGTRAMGILTTSRNPRSFALLGPEPLREAHYAAMPTALVEPLLLASTSARGVCPRCGAPWARVVERTAMQIARSTWGEEAGNRTASSGTMVAPAESRTLGWHATCACAAGEPVPATILDPFAGTGTSGAVAVRHRRRAVLCDLSQTYLRDIADARTRGVQVELAL